MLDTAEQLVLVLILFAIPVFLILHYTTIYLSKSTTVIMNRYRHLILMTLDPYNEIRFTVAGSDQ